VRRWRVDRDHSSPYHAYQNLPEKKLYSPEEVLHLELADDLVEDGLSKHFKTPYGSLNLNVPIRVNGVTYVEIFEWEEHKEQIQLILNN
jgi:hypothetical protein